MECDHEQKLLQLLQTFEKRLSMRFYSNKKPTKYGTPILTMKIAQCTFAKPSFVDTSF